MVSKLNFRLRGFTLLTAVLLAFIFFISPAQFPVVLYKTCQITFAAVLGYWLDRHIFPESRPSELYEIAISDPSADNLARTSMLRRAGVVAGTMIAFALAL